MVIASPYFSASLMKGRRALPTAEASTGQKPRQRLTTIAIIKFLRNGKHLAQRPTYLIQQEGEIGVPFVAASCACLGARKAITSANRKNAELTCAFFCWRPCASPPLLFAVPRHSLRKFRWRGSSERLRLQGQPLSWLLARSGLSCRPPNPQTVLVPRNLLAGVAAPLLFCAPACASARRFP